MSPVAILGQPAPLYDYEVSGPFPTRTALFSTAANFSDGFIGNTWMPRSDINATPRDLWVFNSVGAGSGESQAAYKGVQARRMISAGPGVIQNGLSGIQLIPITDGAGLDVGFANPSWRRVNWFSWMMAMDPAATLSPLAGVVFEAQAGQQTTTHWPTGGAANWFGGFGVVGDGAGGWDWTSWGALATGLPPGPVTETVALAAIADPEDWNQFEVVIISAAGGRAASLELWVNGVLTLTRDWVSAPALLGLVPQAAVDFYKFSPIAQSDASNTPFWLGDFFYRMGRYTRGGRELSK